MSRSSGRRGADGYSAVQLGFDEARKLSKAEAGHLKGLPKLRHLREVAGTSEGLELGQTLSVDIFTKGEIVDVVGVSKGKGFAGVVKRHGFAGRIQNSRAVGPASCPWLYRREFYSGSRL